MKKQQQVMSRVKSLFAKIFWIRIREATPEDFGMINLLLEKTFQTAMKNNDFEFRHKSDFIESIQEIYSNTGKIYVALYRKKMVGTD